jgi:hypothetical protein
MINKRYKLPREFTKEWLTALRSGKYEQTSGSLYNIQDQGYCCIGVAAKIKYPLHYLKNKSNKYAGVLQGNKKSILQENKKSICSDTKYKLSKIPQELKGNVHANNFVSQLVNLNDDEGYSFEEIAEWIEKNVELYD